ncbi:TIR domain-containing protein [Sphingobium lactosutens]|uniref:TIR domain-containing protein n=1 Tax=Sphingobium lactosutens TaxID=522773 RepID=UPI0015BDEE69|nr:TIR domain-containing protein [Sphingobium lactosutens]
MDHSLPGEVVGRTLFLSYSRDDRDRVMPIISALERRGLTVWWDGLLAGGQRFAHTTESALESADIILVVWTARSIQSHWVRDEATRGRDRGRMVSVTLDGVEPPLGFRQVQYIDLAQWTKRADSSLFRELLRAVEAVAAAPGNALSIERPQSATAQGGRKLSRRGAMIAGASGIAALAGGYTTWRSGLLSPKANDKSIAVLPFENLSDDPKQTYFSDGLSEELRATLSLNPQLAVAALTSSDSFRTGARTIAQISRVLDVAYILEGSVRRSGESLRVTARLIKGATGFQSWSETFNRKLANVLDVQNEIATNVVDSLIVSLDGDKASGKRRIGGTSSLAAFDSYLHGMALYNLAADERSDRGALAAFDRAVSIDPAYAAAHAARSRALTVIGSSYASGKELARYFDEAIAAARKAIQLAPSLAEGHSALGFILSNGRLDLAGARQPYEKSFELGYGNAAILGSFALYAAFIGTFDDARKATARATRLDPLNASVLRTAAIVEFCARAYDAAQQAVRGALALNRKVNNVHRILGDIALVKGDYAAAKGYFEAETSPLSRIRGLAITDARLAGQAAGDRRFAEMKRKYGDNSLYQQALIFSQWGRKGDALAALERGLAIGDAGLVLANTDPLLDPIRQEYRFQTILQQIGLGHDRVA